MTHLLEDTELPSNFKYPGALVRLIDRGITGFEPWRILDAPGARGIAMLLAKAHPHGHLVPFAKRDDNDDVASFDVENPGKIIVTHDYMSDGWEYRDVLDDFYAWLRRAVEDMIEFDILEEP